MSRLLDLLDRIARGAPSAMGFTAAAQRPTPTPLALLVWMEGQGDAMDTRALAEARVDAVVLPRGAQDASGLERQVKPLEQFAWGVEVEGLGRERVEAYRDAGSDFLVFPLEGTQADALQEGDMARILRLPTGLEEATLRSLEDLPVDAILLCPSEPEGPMTLAHLAAIANVRGATSKYVLVQWGADLTARELEHLRNLGVDGVVVKVHQGTDAKLPALRAQIEALPKRRPRGEQRPAALIPRVGAPFPGPRHEEEEEEEEGEEEGL